MKQAADRHALAKLVKAGDGRLSLKDLGGNAMLGQDGQGLGTDVRWFQTPLESTIVSAPLSMSS
jgi:hypothetical protein